MKNYIYILALVLTAFISSCENDDIETSDLNFVSFQTETAVSVVEGEDNTKEIKVFTSNITNTDRTFTFTIDEENSTLNPSQHSIPSEVIVPANSNVGSFFITLDYDNVNPDDDTLVLVFDGKEGLFTGSSITLNIAQTCLFTEVTLSLVFDFYASETSWEILDSSDNVFADSGDGYSDGDDPYSEVLCIPSGDYTFIIYDVFQDGICCAYGNGSYNLFLTEDGTSLASGGEFGASESTSFTVN